MTAEQRRQFVLDHRTAIFGYGGAQHRPAMSIVFCSADPEEIVVSTMAERAKAKAAARNKVSLCVLDKQRPPSYLPVYCDEEIDTNFDFVVDVRMRIAGVMAGTRMSEDVRPMVEEGAHAEKQVALRPSPYATFYAPPRHVQSESDIGPGLPHEKSASVPW